MENNDDMTIEKLAEMTQKGFVDVETRLSKKMDTMQVGMDTMQVGLVQLVESVLTVVQNIQGRMDEIHTVGRIDVPDLRDRVEALETDMEKVKEKVKIPA
ncbi:MAG: hypothetical protein Q8R30_00890 [bacterium]|nr:hypothetical protein [bacterium]